MSARPVGNLSEPEARDLGDFQIVSQRTADKIIAAICLCVLIFGALPDVSAWIQGKPPVGICR